MDELFPLELWHKIVQFTVGQYNYTEPVTTALDQFRQTSTQAADIGRQILASVGRLNLRVWDDRTDTLESFKHVQKHVTALAIPFFIKYPGNLLYPMSFEPFPVKLFDMILAYPPPYPNEWKIKTIQLIGIMDPGHQYSSDSDEKFRSDNLRELASYWQRAILLLPFISTIETIEFRFVSHFTGIQDISNASRIYMPPTKYIELGVLTRTLVAISRFPRLRTLSMHNVSRKSIEPLFGTQFPVTISDFADTPQPNQPVTVNLGELVGIAFNLLRHTPDWVQIHVDTLFIYRYTELHNIPAQRVVNIDTIQMLLSNVLRGDFETDDAYVQDENLRDDRFLRFIGEIKRICQLEPSHFTILATPAAVRPRRLYRLREWIFDVFPRADVTFGVPQRITQDSFLPVDLDNLYRTSGRGVLYEKFHLP